MRGCVDVGEMDVCSCAARQPASVCEELIRVRAFTADVFWNSCHCMYTCRYLKSRQRSFMLAVPFSCQHFRFSSLHTTFFFDSRFFVYLLPQQIQHAY